MFLLYGKQNHFISEFQGIQDFCDDSGEAVLSLLVNLKDQENQKACNEKKVYEQDEGKLQSEIDKLR